MRWEAITAFRTIAAGVRLCVYQTPQSRTGPAPTLRGSQQLPIQLGDGTWLPALVTDAGEASAILVMPDGERYQITPRRSDERPSGITMGGHMESQDWVIRGRIVPGSISPFT